MSDEGLIDLYTIKRGASIAVVPIILFYLTVTGYALLSVTFSMWEKALLCAMAVVAIASGVFVIRRGRRAHAIIRQTKAKREAASQRLRDA